MIDWAGVHDNAAHAGLDEVQNGLLGSIERCHVTGLTGLTRHFQIYSVILVIFTLFGSANIPRGRSGALDRSRSKRLPDRFVAPKWSPSEGGEVSASARTDCACSSLGKAIMQGVRKIIQKTRIEVDTRGEANTEWIEKPQPYGFTIEDTFEPWRLEPRLDENTSDTFGTNQLPQRRETPWTRRALWNDAESSSRGQIEAGLEGPIGIVKHEVGTVSPRGQASLDLTFQSRELFLECRYIRGIGLGMAGIQQGQSFGDRPRHDTPVLWIEPEMHVLFSF